MWSKSHGNTSSYVLRDVASIRIGELTKNLKNSTQIFHLGENKLPSYHDKKIFPMRPLNCYIDKRPKSRSDRVIYYYCKTIPQGF